MASEDKELIRRKNELKMEFEEDTKIIASQAADFVSRLYPLNLIETKEEILSKTCQNADEYLNCFRFLKINSCIAGEVENLQEYMTEKMDKLYAVMHSFGAPIAYGAISENRVESLIIGVYDPEVAIPFEEIVQGVIDGAVVETIKPAFSNCSSQKRSMGMISVVPSTKVDEKKQSLDLAPLMRSINGQDFIMLFIAKPVSQEKVSEVYSELIDMRDNCFAVSKRNISRQVGITDSEGTSTAHTESHSVTKTNGVNYGLSLILTVTGNHSKAKSESTSDAYGTTISKAVSKNEGISSEIQNGYALELIDYIDKAIERFRVGRNNGMWETSFCFSATEKHIADMINSHVLGELAQQDPDMLPAVSKVYDFEPKELPGACILAPDFFEDKASLAGISSVISSAELGMLCSIPCTPVPNFEVKKGILYPMHITDGDVKIGSVCSGMKKQEGMKFAFTKKDLVKHTFVCGITGSGKTTTVKRLLSEAGVPFCVIESAKKEYRNLSLAEGKQPEVYTLGKPELNCLRINPFYVQHGVSPQAHIDYLKDLFNASFSFYGPMPYILEKCLYNVYEKKGWNLTLGYHPLLADTKSPESFYEKEKVSDRYKTIAHKHLFPTMQDLKDEIVRYVEQEMNYEGEVVGNIKTAMVARIEGLCSGPKGYMFNTYSYAPMDELLKKPIVIELEGLSDDSDKAFCVGLLIVLINEYRQVYKETESETDEQLNHLLVIEEAHRLLRNVETERTSENMGNPKGKAVEHFTNMIAEMRSYGQGVIIAEQIPTKLAPDVIKNSSNKIIQRLVAADDQKVVANTIGMREDDALFIGNILPHYALCHKEGMALPVSVLVDPATDVIVTDTNLYQSGNAKDKFFDTAVETIRECAQKIIPIFSLKIINSMMIQGPKDVENAMKAFFIEVEKTRRLNGISLMFINEETKKDVYALSLINKVIDLLQHGVYSANALLTDEVEQLIEDILKSAGHSSCKEEKLLAFKEKMRPLYNNEDVSYYAQLAIVNLILRNISDNTDIKASVKNFFVEASDELVSTIKDKVILEGRKLYGISID